MPFRSLRSRLTLGVLAVLAVVLVLGGAYVADEADETERRAVDDRLQRTAELLDSAVESLLDDDPSNPDDRRLDRVLSATGSTLLVTVDDQVLYPVERQGERTRRPALGLGTRDVGSHRIRTYGKAFNRELFGGRARLEATTDLRPVEARQASLRRRLVGVGVVMLALTGLGTALAAGLVLRPLRRLRQHARGIDDERHLDARVPVAGPREIRELAGSFNAMLERLGRSADERARALDATRRFAADAGHELRTPLTSVRAALSTIERHPDVDPETRAMIVGDALDENRRLVALLDGLQALARGDATDVAHADVDLATVVAEAAEQAGALHPGVTVETRLPDGPVVVRGWEPGVRSVADNLVRNAARHGRPGGHVMAEVRPGTATRGPTFVVEDDGDGIGEDERERVFAPFARAADARAPGSGLGLAIVAQQARHHGATVAVEDATLGGARFVVRFPRR